MKQGVMPYLLPMFLVTNLPVVLALDMNKQQRVQTNLKRAALSAILVTSQKLSA